MYDKDISDVITKEVVKALKANQPEISSNPYRILGIITHYGQGLEQLVIAFIKMAKEQVPILIWTISKIDKFIKMKAQSASLPTLSVEISDDFSFDLSNLANLENIIYGAFSFEIADKIIQLKDEDPIVNVMLQGLLTNIPVSILTPFPLAELTFEYHPSKKINRELRQRITLLSEMGFYLIDEHDLKDRYLVTKPKDKIVPDLITESYIESMRNKTHELRLPRTAIITPLAYEKAHDLEIRIVRI
ncbi:MAG: hypothetical protein ACXAC7_03510 [Candidatus Hodarchaeales archaeon]|jgi:hypothetical protein